MCCCFASRQGPRSFHESYCSSLRISHDEFLPLLYRVTSFLLYSSPTTFVLSPSTRTYEGRYNTCPSHFPIGRTSLSLIQDFTYVWRRATVSGNDEDLNVKFLDLLPHLTGLKALVVKLEKNNYTIKWRNLEEIKESVSTIVKTRSRCRRVDVELDSRLSREELIQAFLPS